MPHDLKDLPEPLSKRLVALSRGEETLPDHRVESVAGWGFRVIGTLVGAAAVVGPIHRAFTWGYPIRARLDEGGVYAAIGFAGFSFVFACGLGILRLLRSRVKPVTVRTKGVVFTTGLDGDPVEVFRLHHEALSPEYAAWLAPIEKMPEAASPSGWGRFVLAALLAAVVTPAVSFPVWVKNVRIAEEREWAQAEQGSWRDGAYKPDAGAYEKYLDWQKWFVRLPPPVTRFTDLAAHAALAQERIEDRLLDEATTATALRAYRARFPKGRHDDAAKAKLHDVYVRASDAYVAQAKAAGADPKAFDGIRALLAFLCESDEPVVRIAFLPVDGLEGGPIEKDAAKKTGSKQVQSPAPSFTAERNRGRERRGAEGLQRAFRRVFPGDIFELDVSSDAKRNPDKKPGPRFLVKYTVLGSGDVYFSSREKEKPIEDRVIFPGILLAFDFTLQIPNLDAERADVPLEDDVAKGHRFSMTATPAVEFSVASSSESAPAAATAVYDAMAETAFDDFERALAKAYGVGAGESGRK